MRSGKKIVGHGAEAPDSGPSDRGGVQLVPVQHGQGSDAAPVQFLIAFVRAMIREHPSRDVLDLAMYAAMREVNITKDQARQFLAAVMAETERSPWPKGFF